MRGLLLCLCLGLQAQSPTGARTHPGVEDLQLRWAPGPTAVLTFRLEPGWHLYWVEPGDSGLPPEATWTLPAGWSAGPLEHPVPQAFVDASGVTYGHAGTVHLVVRLQGTGSLKGPVAVDLDWLVCREGCVPGRARLTGSPASGAPFPEALWQDLQQRLPRAATQERVQGPPRIDRSRVPWRMTIPFGPLPSGARFYPRTPEGFTVVHGEVRLDRGLLHLPLIPSTPDVRLTTLHGILAWGRQGEALTVDLSRTEHP